MVVSQSPAPTVDHAILAALAAGDHRRAAMLLRRAFGTAAHDGEADLPELLEELAEYFASAHREEDAVAAAAWAALVGTTHEGGPDELRRRRRIAEMLLRMGLPDDACAVYAAVAAEAPCQTWVHEAAASDYADAGDFELAFAWVTAGLEQAVTQEEKTCIARLLGLRRMAMDALELSADDLDQQASAVLRQRQMPSAAADDLELLVELDGDGVPPERALRLLGILRASPTHSR